jgi:hypothetical protein
MKLLLNFQTLAPSFVEILCLTDSENHVVSTIFITWLLHDILSPWLGDITMIGWAGASPPSCAASKNFKYIFTCVHVAICKVQRLQILPANFVDTSNLKQSTCCMPPTLPWTVLMANKLCSSRCVRVRLQPWCTYICIYIIYSYIYYMKVLCFPFVRSMV